MRTFLDRQKWMFAALFLTLPLFSRPAYSAPLLYRMKSDASIIHFEGDSTLHAFKGYSREVEGEAHFDPETGETFLPETVHFKVRSLTTGNSRRDEAMYAMFQEKKYSEIEWRASSILCAEPDSSGSTSCEAEGILRMTGVEKPVNFTLKLSRQPGGLAVTGETLVTTDMFGLRPPSFLGLVKVSKNIRIHFQTIWLSGPSSASGKL